MLNNLQFVNNDISSFAKSVSSFSWGQTSRIFSQMQIIVYLSNVKNCCSQLGLNSLFNSHPAAGSNQSDLTYCNLITLWVGWTLPGCFGLYLSLIAVLIPSHATCAKCTRDRFKLRKTVGGGEARHGLRNELERQIVTSLRATCQGKFNQI